MLGWPDFSQTCQSSKHRLTSPILCDVPVDHRVYGSTGIISGNVLERSELKFEPMSLCSENIISLNATYPPAKLCVSNGHAHWYFYDLFGLLGLMVESNWHLSLKTWKADNPSETSLSNYVQVSTIIYTCLFAKLFKEFWKARFSKVRKAVLRLSLGFPWPTDFPWPLETF